MGQNVISIKIDLPENKDGFYVYINMGKYCVSTAENKKIWQKIPFPILEFMSIQYLF